MNLASQNLEQLKSPLFKQIEVIKQEEKLAELKVTTRRRTWHIQIQLLSGSKVLPEIKLLDKDLIGKLAHVNACGTICVSDEEGALIDYYRDDFISNYLEFVIERLEEFYLAAKVENFDALYDEFEGYWGGIYSDSNTYCFFEPGDVPSAIDFRIKKSSSGVKICSIGDLAEFDKKYALYKKVTELTKVNGLYVPLCDYLLPPPNGEGIGRNYLNVVLDTISSENKKLIEQMLNKRFYSCKEMYVLLSFPRISKEKSLLALYIKNLQTNSNPLLDKRAPVKVSAFLIKRHFPNYLRERAGILSHPSSLNIMILGCGSVGSEIIYQAVRIGINQLTLVDFDNYNLDNLLRNRLGAQHLDFESKNKALCIADDLLRNIPYLQVKTITNAQVYDVDFKSCNFIISAMGQPTKNLDLNKKLKTLSIPCIYAWNEGVGLGGHAVFIHPQQEGCLECLYFIDRKVAPFKYAMLGSGQPITRNLTGCGGTFVPFTYHDSCQTATLVTRLISQYLMGKLARNVAYRWIGDNPHGLEVTSNWSSDLGLVIQSISENKTCRVCYG